LGTPALEGGRERIRGRRARRDHGRRRERRRIRRGRDVSLRGTATDVAGGQIEQTIIHAYRIAR